ACAVRAIIWRIRIDSAVERERSSIAGERSRETQIRTLTLYANGAAQRLAQRQVDVRLAQGLECERLGLQIEIVRKVQLTPRHAPIARHVRLRSIPVLMCELRVAETNVEPAGVQDCCA